MNRRRSHASKKSNSVRELNITEQKQLEILKSIQDNTSLNVFGMVPAVRDIPRMRLKRDRVHTFERSYPSPNYSVTSPTSSGFSVSFNLNDAPNATEISSLFDQFRIVQATATWVPILAPTGAIVYTAFDYDDAATPTFAELYQKESFQMNQVSQSFTRVLVPSVTSQIYAGAVTTAYGIQKNQWLDSGTINVPHYGLKITFQAPSTGTATGFFQITLVIQGRSVR